jgi:hypothetical protein
MESAFGIDHGYEEIEKFGFGALGAKIGVGAVKAGQGLSRGSAQMRRAGRAAGPGFMGSAQKKIGAAGGMAGGQLRKLGQGMQKRPGLTGGLAAGGAAAGAGGAGGAFMNRQRRF